MCVACDMRLLCRGCIIRQRIYMTCHYHPFQCVLQENGNAWWSDASWQAPAGQSAGSVRHYSAWEVMHEQMLILVVWMCPQRIPL